MIGQAGGRVRGLCLAVVTMLAIAACTSGWPGSSVIGSVRCPTEAPDPELTDGATWWLPERLRHLAPHLNQIQDAAAGDPLFIGISPDFATDGITVYWNGTPPAFLDPAIAEAAEVGIPVGHVNTPWPGTVLEHNWDVVGAALQQEGIRLHTIGQTPEFDALLISGPDVSTDRALQTKTCETALETVGAVPISFIPDQGVDEPAGG